MIILHAGFLDEKLFLWGEKKADEDFTLPRRKRKTKKIKPREYYFDAGDKVIKKALKNAGLKLRISKKNINPQLIHFPTFKGIPISSSSLVFEHPDMSGKLDIYPWIVTAIELSGNNLIDLLKFVYKKKMLTKGVVVGSDLSYFSHALRFAGYIVTGQKFLPGIAVSEEGMTSYRAIWEPVLTGADKEYFDNLAGEMPDSCRALSEEATSPPDNSSTSILKKFIDITTHYIISTGIKPMTTRRRKFDSNHDKWLYNLRYPDGAMDGRDEEMEELYSQVRLWKQPLSVTLESPFKLCFRIEEPGFDEDSESDKITDSSWNIRYLLQARDDPSLLIPAKEAWMPSKKLLKTIDKKDFSFPEFLLHSLGRASGICPRIEESLKTSLPGGYDVDIVGAYEFLTNRAWSLEQSGFGVFLPFWWSPKGTKKRLAARANAKAGSTVLKGGGFLSLDSVVEFDWKIALGDEDITYRELAELAKLKVPLVKFRGQWVQLDAGEIREALSYMKEKLQKATVRDLVKMKMGVPGMTGKISVDEIIADGWLGDFLKKLEKDASFEEMSPPSGFDGTLRPYQARGFSWLNFMKQWGLGACLADDMGLGKTIQVLTLIQQDREAGNQRPALVICPTSVMSNWKKETNRFTPGISVFIHHGTKREKGEGFKEIANENSIIISSYSLLHRDFETFKKIDWRGLILDEAQNIKNPGTRTAKAARSLKADYKITMTGTPVENNIGDLWSIMEFLNPGFLGNQTEFKRKFFIPIQVNRSREAMESLKHITGPFILRRLKTDKSIISDLPDKMEMKVYCNLTREQATLYEAVAKETMDRLDSREGMERRGLILATISKLKQICNHPVQFLGDNSKIEGRSGKMARISEMLEEIIEMDERALIFTQFSEMGKLLQQYFQDTYGKEVFFLYGSTPRKQRERMVEEFQDNPHGPHIFILSLKAGGTGLNLTRATHVFHFDRWWNPAVENQATDRAYRIGQTKNVQVHKFICSGTLEEKIDDMITSKIEIAENVIGTGEGWLTELSSNEIRNILTLRNDAIGD